MPAPIPSHAFPTHFFATDFFLPAVFFTGASAAAGALLPGADTSGSSAWMYSSACASVLYIFQLPAMQGVRELT